jgi:hypothetical protein
MTDIDKISRSINLCETCGFDFRIFGTSADSQLAAEIARLRSELSAAAAARQDAERMRGALNRYRYAHAFAGADSWDGGSDMRRRLEWAHASDEGRFLTNDQIAAIGKTFPDRAALQGAAG